MVAKYCNRKYLSMIERSVISNSTGDLSFRFLSVTFTANIILFCIGLRKAKSNYTRKNKVILHDLIFMLYLHTHVDVCVVQ